MIYKIYSAQYKYFLYLSRFCVFFKNIKILKVLPFLFLSLIYSQEILAQIESLYDPKKDQFANISNLMSATSNNDIDGVRFFSKSGSLIVNQKNKGGASALHIASREGNFEIVKILIENGADVNLSDNEGWTPLMRASLSKSPNIVEMLIKKGAKSELFNIQNETAIIQATTSGCLECLNIIIKDGNLIKNLDTLTLKGQIADAFLIARNSENQQIQGVLEGFLDYVSKITPLVRTNNSDKNSNVPLLLKNNINIKNNSANQSYPSQFNYKLKNQDDVLEKNLSVPNQYIPIENPAIQTKNIEVNSNKDTTENIDI
jgi:ankyrin repeat protein